MLSIAESSVLRFVEESWNRPCFAAASSSCVAITYQSAASTELYSGVAARWARSRSSRGALWALGEFVEVASARTVSNAHRVFPAREASGPSPRGEDRLHQFFGHVRRRWAVRVGHGGFRGADRHLVRA